MKWPRGKNRAGDPVPDSGPGPETGTDVSAEQLAVALAQVSAAGSAEALREGTREGLLPPEAFVPLADVEPVSSLTNIPGVPGVFVGREAEVRLLEETLDTDRGRVVAVHGLGGVGKTTLAAYVAARNTAEGRVVWWARAETGEEIDAGLVDFARALQPVLAVLPADTLRERALQWFSAHDDWMLVLDDVDQPDDVRGLLARLNPRGRVLVTTRRSGGWHGVATDLRIDALDEPSAIELFRRISDAGGANASGLTGIRTLCRELGHLPLAIEQAAAYCRVTYMGADDYLALLHDYPAETLASSAEGWAPERTVARVWQISLDRLRDNPLASDLLRIMAWYAPRGIPRTLLVGLGHKGEVLRALAGLAAHSLITLDRDTVSVHPLVQATARTPDPADPHRAPERIQVAQERATDLLLASLPDDFVTRESLSWWNELLPQVDHLDAHIQPRSATPAMAVLRARTGQFLVEQGSVRRAVTLLERAVEDVTRELGRDHQDTLALLNNLAGAYASAGDTRRAVTLYEDVHERQSRVLGDHHPGTLVTAANLALAYHALGDVEHALTSYESILDTQRRILGEDHPRTLVTRHNLAAAYASAGDIDRSVETYENLLHDQVRILGAEHIQTLGTENNLAAALASSGDLAGARARYTQLLEELIRVVGEDHPDTITTRGNLAYVHLLSGDVVEARESYERVLADQIRVLGEDDPRTLATVNNLGLVHGAVDPGRALELLERALTDRQRVLGADHPDTLTSLASFAFALMASGDDEQALPLLEKAAADRVRILGEEHPDTIASHHDLAQALWSMGHPVEAEAMLARTHDVARRVLGDEHSLTLSLRTALNGIRGDR
ncbi:FxSxx-COOH system tetratricopeptide repeat protein [Streptomyces cylindrosporus]|uniref:FxSxx-COOH system tetratricopeptide repeat protein n=1 Tax=Streptomyces cylindrosporus TaxID=2927583 RepID=A0ABS9Y9A5_9ACTN|nr:FxSxx-COOH system tetratricopeptide repeat protein [Streptomyces cylindrosporus]MCI3273814.1 FxSxx-COOH system tetratricopeptide repeat protein [Streptomyces cylindrosporus]